MIEAIVVFVQDLANCTAFYRDTFKLQYQGSDAHSASFLLEEGLYLILLSPQGAADLLGTQANELKIEAGPRGLLAAGVANVDAAYEDSKRRASHLSDPQPTRAGDYARRLCRSRRQPLGDQPIP